MEDDSTIPGNVRKKVRPEDSNSWIVEDDPHAARAIQLMLEREGTRATLLTSGAALLDALHSSENAPDIICLDISLPDFSGLELLRYIKQKDPFVPVIIITSDTTDEAISEAVELGAYDYIPKNSDRTKFTTTFRRAVEYKRLREQLDAISDKQSEESTNQDCEATGTLQEKEREAILESLRKTSGHISKAAEVLGVSRATLYRKMKKYNISTRGQF